MSNSKVKLLQTTVKGRDILGKIFRSSRELHNWSIDDVVYQVRLLTGLNVSKSTISHIERGNTMPNFDTLALLASIEYVLNPDDEQPLSIYEMLDIACEVLTPSLIEHPPKSPGKQGRTHLPKAASSPGSYSVSLV